jgi:steroid delta-isomerase-like uncharacterized protein
MNKSIFLISTLLLVSCANNKHDHIALVQHYYAALKAADTTAVETFLAPDFIKHNNEDTATLRGPAEFIASVRRNKANNTEYGFLVEDIFAEDNKVAVRWTWKSVNIKYGAAKPMEVPGLAIFHIELGRISELWQTFDMVGYNRQLGLIQ